MGSYVVTYRVKRDLVLILELGARSAKAIDVFDDSAGRRRPELFPEEHWPVRLLVSCSWLAMLPAFLSGRPASCILSTRHFAVRHPRTYRTAIFL